MVLLLVAIGGAIGSLLRYLLTGLVHRVAPPVFPYGTFVVNVVGCAVFGVLAGLAYDRAALGVEVRAFLLVGVLGGFTTFSAFGFETLELMRAGHVMAAAANAAGQVVLGVLAIWVGFAVSRVL